MGKIKEERDWRSDDRSLEGICRFSSRKIHTQSKQKRIQLKDIMKY